MESTFVSSDPLIESAFPSSRIEESIFASERAMEESSSATDISSVALTPHIMIVSNSKPTMIVSQNFNFKTPQFYTQLSILDSI